MSNPNVHLHVNLPLVVAGGGAGSLKGGRHSSFDRADNVPMTNLLVSMLDKAGVTVDRLGDSTGPDRSGYVDGDVSDQMPEVRSLRPGCVPLSLRGRAQHRRRR